MKKILRSTTKSDFPYVEPEANIPGKHARPLSDLHLMKAPVGKETKAKVQAKVNTGVRHKNALVTFEGTKKKESLLLEENESYKAMIIKLKGEIEILSKSRAGPENVAVSTNRDFSLHTGLYNDASTQTDENVYGPDVDTQADRNIGIDMGTQFSIDDVAIPNVEKVYTASEVVVDESISLAESHATNNQNGANIAPTTVFNFPDLSNSELKLFHENLANKDFFSHFRSRFNQFRAPTMHATVREVCMNVVSDKTLKDYSYQGKPRLGIKKLRFKDYDNIADLIVKASTDSFVKTLEVGEEIAKKTKDEIEEIEKTVEIYFTKEYIKQAPRRFEDAEKKRF